MLSALLNGLQKKQFHYQFTQGWKVTIYFSVITYYFKDILL